jgi:hypothetical protein
VARGRCRPLAPVWAWLRTVIEIEHIEEIAIRRRVHRHIGIVFVRAGVREIIAATGGERREVPYPMLAWRWYIELPIRSPLDERTREGDDHPARLFLRFLSDQGEKRAMEVIWGNRLKPGDYKYIGGFPHFVAHAGDDRVGRWLDERIDLARVYATIWKDAAPAHLVDVAVFCDSDDTHTASVSYFAYVRLERR